MDELNEFLRSEEYLRICREVEAGTFNVNSTLGKLYQDISLGLVPEPRPAKTPETPKIVEKPEIIYNRFLTREILEEDFNESPCRSYRDGDFKEPPSGLSELYSFDFRISALDMYQAMKHLVKALPNMFSKRTLEYRDCQLHMFSSNINSQEDFLLLNVRGISPFQKRVALHMDGAVFSSINEEREQSVACRVLPEQKSFDIYNNMWMGLGRRSSIRRSSSALVEGIELEAWVSNQNILEFSSKDCINPEEGEIAKSLIDNVSSLKNRIVRICKDGHTPHFSLKLPYGENVYPTSKYELYLTGYTSISTGVYTSAPTLDRGGSYTDFGGFIKPRHLAREINQGLNLESIPGIKVYMDNGCIAKIYTKTYYEGLSRLTL